MSHLEQHISVACPLAQAGMRLRHFFSENGNADGDTVKLSLHININAPGLATALTLKRSVIATIQAHHLPADMEPRYRVQWAPESPGPFPLFEGELVVDCIEDYDSFTLALNGDYTPPLGLVGKGFDVVVGNRVAQATASDLLHRIREHIEREFAADENRKHHPEPQPELHDAPREG